jgi:hypothetical protein
MTTVETIHQKVLHLPPQAQEEVLDAVENIEQRYRDTAGNGEGGHRHILDQLSEISIEGPSDLSSEHHRYAHGSPEHNE